MLAARGGLNGARLSGGLVFGLARGGVHCSVLLLFYFGQVEISLLQPFTALAAFFVVSLFCQACAPCGLSSQEFCRSHVHASEIPDYCIAALFFPHCNINITVRHDRRSDI
jgi:hypothetical protein